MKGRTEGRKEGRKEGRTDVRSLFVRCRELNFLILHISIYIIHISTQKLCLKTKHLVSTNQHNAGENTISSPKIRKKFSFFVFFASFFVLILCLAFWDKFFASFFDLSLYSCIYCNIDSCRLFLLSKAFLYFLYRKERKRVASK